MYNMQLKIKNLLPLFAYSILIISSLSSCISTKNVTYLKDIPQSPTSDLRIKETSYVEPLIQPDDILSITVQTIDPQNSSILNQVSPPMPSIGSSSASSMGNQVITGFLVDKEGQVELPMMGKIKIAGLSTFKARDLIREKSAVYFKNPTVQVRYANYKITILGEVSKPATYTMPNEKVSILDAIGLAGDLTIFGKRENVLLIRENNGVKEFARFDLNSSSLFSSPYFYLRQNDIIYVEPNKNKVVSANAQRTRNITIFASILSVIIIITARVKF